MLDCRPPTRASAVALPWPGSDPRGREWGREPNLHRMREDDREIPFQGAPVAAVGPASPVSAAAGAGPPGRLTSLATGVVGLPPATGRQPPAPAGPPEPPIDE